MPRYSKTQFALANLVARQKEYFKSRDFTWYN